MVNKACQSMVIAGVPRYPRIARVPLVMANLVEREFTSIYEPYVRLRGGAYYGLAAEGRLDFRPNPEYGPVPPLRVINASELSGQPVRQGIPIYRQFIDDPGTFNFLMRPDAFSDWRHGGS